MAERKTDIGPPHYEQFLPPVIKKNYGKWKYHEIVRPGVLMHVAESGDKLFSVRAATPRLASTKTLRMFADIAEDLLPETGLVAPSRVLGPYSDLPLSHRQRVVSGGVIACSPCMPHTLRPIDRWTRDRKASPSHARTAAKMVDRAPPLLWTVTEGRWTPALPGPSPSPIAARLLPLCEGDPATSPADGWWLARVFRDSHGRHHAGLALRLPSPIRPQPLLARLLLEWARSRYESAPGAPPRQIPKEHDTPAADEPTRPATGKRGGALSWCRFLRYRGDTLYRCAHEMAWLGECT